jgi:hypothetical protein
MVLVIWNWCLELPVIPLSLGGRGWGEGERNEIDFHGLRLLAGRQGRQTRYVKFIWNLEIAI